MAGSAVAFHARRLFGQGAPAPIQSTKLTDRLYIFQGDGGNVAILTSPEGHFMVDGGLAERAADLAAAIAQVNKKPVTQLFDTHWHVDHVGSNVLLGQSGAKIIASDNTRTRLSSKQTMEIFHRTFEPLPAAGIPGVTFHSAGKIEFAGETIEYTPVAPAHTDGDTYLFFREANVLHTGDLLFNGFYPVIDYSSKGWLGGMAAAADQMLKTVDAKTRVVPGHGPIGTQADLAAFRDMATTLNDRFVALVKQGKTMDEIVAAKPTRDLDDKWSKGMLKPDQFVAMAVTSITRHQQTS
jgi:cyclase